MKHTLLKEGSSSLTKNSQNWWAGHHPATLDLQHLPKCCSSSNKTNSNNSSSHQASTAISHSIKREPNLILKTTVMATFSKEIRSTSKIKRFRPSMRRSNTLWNCKSRLRRRRQIFHRSGLRRRGGQLPPTILRAHHHSRRCTKIQSSRRFWPESVRSIDKSWHLGWNHPEYHLLIDMKWRHRHQCSNNSQASNLLQLCSLHQVWCHQQAFKVRWDCHLLRWLLSFQRHPRAILRRRLIPKRLNWATKKSKGKEWQSIEESWRNNRSKKKTSTKRNSKPQ